MAGLAAALTVTTANNSRSEPSGGVIDALAWSLSARGADGAVCRLTAPHGGTAAGVRLDLAIRAAMPAITRVVPAVDDGATDKPPQPIAALVVDGVASVTALDRAYAERGPAGLVDEGEQPYAVILADAERGELVLARNGAGPALYYARLDDGWVVASEPAALVHAGVEPEPDVAVVRRFIQTGACDESERTFFARVRRVLPGEAIVLSTAVSGPVRHPIRWSPPQPDDLGEAIWSAGAGTRVGVLATPGLGGAAILGAALHQPGRRRPPRAFAVSIDGIEPTGSGDLLHVLPAATVQPVTLAASLDLSTLDRFLADMGEPVPDLGSYLLWTVARELSGDIDILVDATPGPEHAWERVTERLLAHYGVAVRAPLRGTTPEPDLLAAVVRRALPPQACQLALEQPVWTPASVSAGIVYALRNEVASVLVPPRPWSDAAASVTALRRLLAGERADADALLRAFLVERWLAGLGACAPGSGTAEVRPVVDVPDEPLREPDEVVIGTFTWWRIPVRTAPIAAGDQVLANAAFYVDNALSAHREHALGPWIAVISGKVVAISQRRVHPVGAVRPGQVARLLSWLARRRWPHLSSPEAMRVAIDHCGHSRLVAAVLFGAALPQQAGVYPPRSRAITPADTAVIGPPSQPDEVAASLVAAMRLALPPERGDTLAGVAVVSAGDTGCRVLGFAPGPASGAVPEPHALLSLVLADNPAGQGAQRTPLVIVAQRAALPAAPQPRTRYADLARSH